MASPRPVRIPQMSDVLMRSLSGGWHGVRGCDTAIFASDDPPTDRESGAASACKLSLEFQRSGRWLRSVAGSPFGFTA